MDNRTRVAILSVVTLLIAVGSLRLAYSLFIQKEEEVHEGTIGTFETEIKGISNNISVPTENTYSLETKTLKSEFEYKNSGDIDTFVRIGYTLVYYDADGKELLIDSDNEIKNSTFFSNKQSAVRAGVGTILVDNTGYEKQFIYPITSDGRGYYRLTAEEALNGTIDMEITSELVNNAKMIVTIETIQATEKALQDAEPSGWDITKYN